ncbi:D-alanine:D-lactate ligase-like protein [Mesorhizobium sp. VK24D]|uniref:D-alanine:D-lactate ligase-like protein n=1 Tax=Mesorhizobium album TaxID=3072314 RepID=A0ABU4Y060_9HYPH|nr:D-alanine:D-lactate ligase-like protein [Mesorhizobium sp. VK24D]MDX8480343.1 D-alanine:D-lactate ligase-like protein [Mesorhizobium sp. VK24D]
MQRNKSTLILVHEPEKACFDRLVADGYPTQRATEISSYLAQSTDLAPEFGQLAAACEKRGLVFMAVELDDAATVLAKANSETTLVWTLTDGIAYFRGGASPALARLNGLRTIGADDSLFALCQDKFRSGAVLGALGLPVPPAGLARDGTWLVEPPASPAGWFVKPNRLGAKIGIWPDSRVADLGHALELSRRVFAHYRDDVVVQPYVAGRNVRASFLGLKPQTGVEALGIVFVESGGDFQTMADSLALYGDTGQAARDAGAYAEPELQPVAASQPAADRAIRALAQRLIAGLGLRDVFSVDLRVEPDDTIHLIEFEVCPGLPCFDFRDYCRKQWGMSLADAMAETAANRLRS